MVRFARSRWRLALPGSGVGNDFSIWGRRVVRRIAQATNPLRPIVFSIPGYLRRFSFPDRIHSGYTEVYRRLLRLPGYRGFDDPRRRCLPSQTDHRPTRKLAGIQAQKHHLNITTLCPAKTTTPKTTG